MVYHMLSALELDTMFSLGSVFSIDVAMSFVSLSCCLRSSVHLRRKSLMDLGKIYVAVWCISAFGDYFLSNGGMLEIFLCFSLRKES